MTIMAGGIGNGVPTRWMRGEAGPASPATTSTAQAPTPQAASVSAKAYSSVRKEEHSGRCLPRAFPCNSLLLQRLAPRLLALRPEAERRRNSAAAGMNLYAPPHTRRPEGDEAADSAEGGKAMAARCPLRSSLYRIGLIVCLLIGSTSALAAAKPRAPLKARAAHRLTSARVTSRHTQVGKASWYGPGRQGKKTASGQRFDQQQLTAAHRTLPLGTRAKVTNLETGQAVQVKINDRGPHARGRIIDLSRAAARRIGLKKDGTTRVRVEASPLSPGSQTAVASHRYAHKAEKRST
jgi:rare lipoprotein A